MKYLPKEEYIYMNCKIKLSMSAMSNLMYAAVITQSAITQTLGIGIYQYTRQQNCQNNIDVVIHIHPSQIERFRSESLVTLTEPIKTNIN